MHFPSIPLRVQSGQYHQYPLSDGVFSVPALLLPILQTPFSHPGFAFVPFPDGAFPSGRGVGGFCARAVILPRQTRILPASLLCFCPLCGGVFPIGKGVGGIPRPGRDSAPADPNLPCFSALFFAPFADGAFPSVRGVGGILCPGRDSAPVDTNPSCFSALFLSPLRTVLSRPEGGLGGFCVRVVVFPYQNPASILWQPRGHGRVIGCLDHFTRFRVPNQYYRLRAGRSNLSLLECQSPAIRPPDGSRVSAGEILCDHPD